MAKSSCIVGWVTDDSVTGSANLSPVTCSTVITGLSRIILRQSLGEELNEAEMALVKSFITKYERGEFDL